MNMISLLECYEIYQAFAIKVIFSCILFKESLFNMENMSILSFIIFWKLYCFAILIYNLPEIDYVWLCVRFKLYIFLYGYSIEPPLVNKIDIFPYGYSIVPPLVNKIAPFLCHIQYHCYHKLCADISVSRHSILSL